MNFNITINSEDINKIIDERREQLIEEFLDLQFMDKHLPDILEYTAERIDSSYINFSDNKSDCIHLLYEIAAQIRRESDIN
jgi:hypothetical protein